MIAPSLALLLALLSPQAPAPAGDLPSTVTIPRLEAEIRIDGALDEPVWRDARRLSGFRQYQPVDGRPAEERTEVLVWYDARAIYFGIIADARDPRTIRATLAERDNIGTDDRVTIYLDTFDDRRRAFFFVVNPLGVQADGVRTEGAVSASSIFGGSVDYNPDFFFDSRGQVTDSGYVVEIRVPFTSLRFPGRQEQRWGLQIVRNVAASGYEDTWTDTRRASASFLAQAGVIEGLRDLERGVVTELQPFVTASMDGDRAAVDGQFARGNLDPSIGANLRLGFTELSLDATINPDFSQVESDAGLVTANERFALFFPEKRPFFLEGIELFGTPNQLVYTRQIVNPDVGAKVTGKVGPWGIALLSALDDAATSGPAPGAADEPVFSIARLRRDLGGNSVAGLVATDVEQGGAYNRVVAADARLVFARLYYIEGQIGGAWTKSPQIGPDAVADAIWQAEFDRTGRSWGFNYKLAGIGDEFMTYAGFVPRTGIVTAHGFNRFTWYGERGALLENVTTFFGPTRIWAYDAFGRRAPIEGAENATLLTTLRGGWGTQLSVGRNFFTFEDALFAGLETDGPAGLEPYDAPDRLDGLYGVWLGGSTPVWERAGATASISYGGVPIFAEGSEGRELRATASLILRATAALRAEATAVYSRITRERDDSEFARTLIPRLRVEYQATRALSFRAIAEYRSERHAELRDARTGAPLWRDGEPVLGDQRGGLQLDWLAAWEPSPGTVAFLGYGSTLRSPYADRFDGLRQDADALFVKIAYLLRR